jgi:hypothetical protein
VVALIIGPETMQRSWDKPASPVKPGSRGMVCRALAQDLNRPGFLRGMVVHCNSRGSPVRYERWTQARRLQSQRKCRALCVGHRRMPSKTGSNLCDAKDARGKALRAVINLIWHQERRGG